MFVISVVMKPLSDKCLHIDKEDEVNLWHRRYGHLNNKAIETMQYKQMVKGLPKLKGEVTVCKVCNMGKQHREMIPRKRQWRATEKLQLIHVDLCGPITPISPSGKRYILVFVDDYTRKTWIYLLTEKIG